MLNVKVIDNIKTKLYPIKHFFVQSTPDELNPEIRFLTPKHTLRRSYTYRPFWPKLPKKMIKNIIIIK